MSAVVGKRRDNSTAIMRRSRRLLAVTVAASALVVATVLINRHLSSLIRSHQALDLELDLELDRNRNRAVLTMNDPSIIRPKKFFAIHIGPSKTGTSTIQKNAKQNPFHENTFGPDKDNLIYVGKRTFEFDQNEDIVGQREIRRVVPIGKTNETVSITPKDENKVYFKACQCMMTILDQYYDSFTNTTIDVINKELETNTEKRASLRQTLIDECWVHSQGRTDFSYMLDFSILDSDEAYSYATNRNLRKKIRLFDILGYDTLIIVGAYRRYADWLVSAFNQQVKQATSEKGDIARTSNDLKSFLELHLNKQGEARYRVRWYNPISVTLPKSLEHGPSKLQARTLNYFQLPRSFNDQQQHKDATRFKTYNSITTELYCDALGEQLTPHTCNYSRSIEQKKSETSKVVANKGDFSDSVYRRIVEDAYISGFLLLSDQELNERRQSCKENEIWCDAVQSCKRKKACKEKTKVFQKRLHQLELGSDNKIIGTDSSNIATFRDLSNYHTGVHKKIWTDSLPTKCIEKNMLEKLLEKSLAFEEMLMPDFYASSLGKDEHTRLFWDVWLKKKKLFCTVDTARLFQGATSWDQIINERMVSYDWGEPTEWV